MSKPTPRPWSFAGTGIITNDQGDEIVLGNLYDEPDADHIVQCVNTHDELLKMLDLAVRELEWADKNCQIKPMAGVSTFKTAVTQIKSALDKARK